LDPIPGVLPFGTICTLAGATGVGKTALVASWVERWTRGATICGLPTNPQPVIGVIVGDRKWESHRQWFDAAGVTHLAHYSLRDDPGWNWDRLADRAAVPSMVDLALDNLALPLGGLLIVDPLSLFISGNLLDYKSVAISLGRLDSQLRPRQLTVLGIFHTAKQKANVHERYLRPQDRILGSMAQLGFSDTAFYLAGPDETGESYYGVGWIPHNAPSGTFALVRDKNGLFVSYDATDDAMNLERAFACFPEDGMTISANAVVYLVQQACGVARAQAYTYLKHLKEHGRIERVGRGLYRVAGLLRLVPKP